MCNLFPIITYNNKVEDFIGGCFMNFNDTSFMDSRHKHHEKKNYEMYYYMYPMSYCPYSYCCPMKMSCPFIHHSQGEDFKYRQPEDDRISYDYPSYNYPGFYPYYPSYYYYPYPYEYSEDYYSYDDYKHHHHHRDYSSHDDHSSGHERVHL